MRFWVLSAAALAGVALMLALGFWQLSRASEKLAVQASVDSREKMEVLDASALEGESANQLLHRTARLRGTWLGSHTVFLDNRQMNGLEGFFVLTPLLLEHSSTAVVVQRGWVQRSFTERTLLPDVPTPQGLVEITGRIAPSPAKLYEFETSHGGLIRQNLDLADFSREISVPLAPVSIMQLSSAQDGLARNWPAADTGVEKNYGYAFQWFALAGLIAFLYVWFQIVRRFFPIA
ncbi:MAG: SURF1 family protein [Burkholderiaceae bacterium]